ncbi:MAG: hypothetical protein ACOVP3_04180, partial [Rhodoluna sp.]
GSGYLSGSLSGGYPEGEYGGGPPARPPKTPQQREEEKKRCDGTYENDKGSLDMATQARFSACTNGEFATVEKYLEKLGILPLIGVQGPQSCISSVKQGYDKSLFDLQLNRAQCKANADK